MMTHTITISNVSIPSSNLLSFRTDMNYMQLNVFRKILMNGIKKWAPDTIEVFENNTCICDELLANRIGLIPIAIKLAEDCDCDEDVCNKCNFSINFKIETLQKNVTIYSHDISPLFMRGIPVALMYNSGVILSMKINCKKGTGNLHSKWSPGVTMSFIDHGGYFDVVLESGDETFFLTYFKSILQKFSNMTGARLEVKV